MVRSTGSPAATLQPSSKLFGNANVGNLSLTNLQVNTALA